MAVKLGDSKALEIHNRLVSHTIETVNKSGVLYKLYLSAEPGSKQSFNYELQSGADLGKRMNNALLTELGQYAKVCLIGSDCLALTSNDIINTYAQLDTADVVPGPVIDGGYYLIGMKKPSPQLFSTMSWGTSSVLEDTLDKCTSHDLLVHQLSLLNDIDRLEDVPDNWL